MRVYKTEGIIIKRKNIGEADRILTVFTKDHGKMQVQAKGVRKITSRRSPHIELLNYTSLTLYKGRLLPIVTEAQHVETFAAIKEDLKKTGIAYHLCEIIDALCPENQENRRIFFLLRTLLFRLTEEEHIFHLVHAFEMDLLMELGYIPNRHIALAKPSLYIEEIIEKKLKTRQFLPQLFS